MSFKNLSPEIQEKIKQLQNLQNQLQALNSQIDVTQGRYNEHKATLKELENVSDNVKLYKSVGQIMFSSNVTQTKKELSEEMEILELQLKTLKKQEEKTRNQLNELNQYLNQIISTQTNKPPSE
jgi:prefoldin beta subunit